MSLFLLYLTRLVVIGSESLCQARFPALDSSYVHLFRVSFLEEKHFNEGSICFMPDFY